MKTEVLFANMPHMFGLVLLSGLALLWSGCAKSPEFGSEEWKLDKIQKAEQGNANAQFDLGCFYLMGFGMPQDEEEAVKWFRKSAEQGNSNALLALGKCYLSGKGVPEDKAEAIRIFRKSAEQGNGHAMFRLGMCYMVGEGVPQDEAESKKWFEAAAKKGVTGKPSNTGFRFSPL